MGHLLFAWHEMKTLMQPIVKPFPIMKLFGLIYMMHAQPIQMHVKQLILKFPLINH